MKNDYEKAVREHFKDLIEPIQRDISAANYDLYFGPFEAGKDIDGDTGENAFIYKGFTTTCALIRDALDGIRDVYVNTQCDYVTESEPQGEEVDGEYIEPFWEDWLHLERRDVLRILLGKELPSYL